MAVTNKLPFSQEQLMQAADWVLVMDDNPDAAQNAEFARWINQQDTNLLAFNEVALTSAITTTLPLQDKKQNMRTSLRTPLKAYIALAASIAFCCLFLLMQNPTEHSLRQSAFATAIGDVSSFTLEDGSSLVLDTNSRAEVLMTHSRRDVQLRQGRLFVSVTHDRTRPFSVAIDDTFAFTALGTAYSVDKNERNWTLEVYKGTVGITSPLVTHAPVNAGWGLRYENHKILRYPLANTVEKTAPDWQQNRIIFDDISLRDAVTQFNRYMTKPITITDPKLASRSISGTFDLGNSEAFMASIIQLTGATVRDTPQQFQIEATSTAPK